MADYTDSTRVQSRGLNGTFARSPASGTTSGAVRTSNALSLEPASSEPIFTDSAVNQRRSRLSKTPCSMSESAKGKVELFNNGKEIWCRRCVDHLRNNAAHRCESNGAVGSQQIKCDHCSTNRHICPMDVAPLIFQQRVRMRAVSAARRSSSDVKRRAFQKALEAWFGKYLTSLRFAINLCSCGACGRSFAYW